MTEHRILSDANIELSEKYIFDNKCNKGYPVLSICDEANAVIGYSEIKELPPTSYVYFGSNAYGMTSYGFYKTRDNKIYIIEAFCNNITTYYSPENCEFLKKTNELKA